MIGYEIMGIYTGNAMEELDNSIYYNKCTGPYANNVLMQTCQYGAYCKQTGQ
jgi:hypothetical protein